MKIIIEKNKRVNICFERFGRIQMFHVEDVIENSDYVYFRLKEITWQNIESGEFTLSKISHCKVES